MDIVSRNTGGGREVVYDGNQVCIPLGAFLCTPFSRTMHTEKRQNEPPGEMFYRGFTVLDTKEGCFASLSPILPPNLLSCNVRNLETIILER